MPRRQCVQMLIIDAGRVSMVSRRCRRRRRWWLLSRSVSLQGAGRFSVPRLLVRVTPMDRVTDAACLCTTRNKQVFDAALGRVSGKGGSRSGQVTRRSVA